MNDTTPEMAKKQAAIMLSKTPSERFMAGIEMIDCTRQMVEESIKREYENISELELKKQVFLRYYSTDFTDEQIEAILNFFH